VILNFPQQTFMGVILGSAVVPIALAILWNKANGKACMAGAVTGFAAGIIAWLVTTAKLNDSTINVDTSGGDYEMLAGNLASICVGGIVSIGASLIWPEDYDFAPTRAMNAPAGSRFALHATSGTHSHDRDVTEYEKDEKKSATVEDARSIQEGEATEALDESGLDPVPLEKAFNFAWWASVVLVCSPLSLSPSRHDN
jgi:hypothetical protein